MTPEHWDGDLESYADAEAHAANLTATTGKEHIAVDKGSHVWPQYGAVILPAIGDLVSERFNGDSYVAGTVTRISKTYSVVTTDLGCRYYRRRRTGAWVRGGMWSLQPGWVSERNPHL